MTDHFHNIVTALDSKITIKAHEVKSTALNNSYEVLLPNSLLNSVQN